MLTVIGWYDEQSGQEIKYPYSEQYYADTPRRNDIVIDSMNGNVWRVEGIGKDWTWLRNNRTQYAVTRKHRDVPYYPEPLPLAAMGFSGW